MISRKQLMTLSLVLICGSMSAQFSPVWEDKFQHTTTNNFSNESRDIVTDASGNVFVLADVTSDLNASGVITGLTYDYTTVLKYTSAGDLVNSALIDVGTHFTSGFDKKSAFSLRVDPAGNVYVGFMNYNATTLYDVNIHKYDNNLASVWAYKFNAITEDVGIDMEVSNNGVAYALVRSTAGTNIRYRLIKASAAGTSATALHTFSSNPDFLNALTLDANQNIYVTGYRLVSGAKALLVSSHNSAGTLRWAKVENGGSVTGDDIGKNLSIGIDNSLYVIGTSDRANNHGIDVISMKMALVNGKIEWVNYTNYNLNDGGFFIHSPETSYVYLFWVASNTVYIDQVSTRTGTLNRRASYQPIPSSSYSVLNGAVIADVEVSVNKMFYVCGTIAATNPAGQQFSAAFLSKINFAGRGSARVEFSAPVNGTFNISTRSSGVALDPVSSQVNWQLDNIETNSSHAVEQAVVIAYNVPSPMRETSPMVPGTFSENTLQVYPNPFSDHLTVQADSEIEKIEITDLSGKLVRVMHPGNSRAETNVSDLPRGTYMARVYTVSGEQTVKKISKQ